MSKSRKSRKNTATEKDIMEDHLKAEIRDKTAQIENRLKTIEKEIVQCYEKGEQFFKTPYFTALMDLKVSLKNKKEQLQRSV